MTFKEAAAILKADGGTHTDADVKYAMDTVKWYENNQLELEDYETDQFHTLIGKIYKIEELNNVSELTKLNVFEAQQRAETLSKVIHIIKLQNDLINHIPNPKKLSDKEVYANYHYLSVALDNIFELNQHLNDDIDKVAAYLYDVAEELQG